MAKKRGIRIRISHQRVDALHDMCTHMMEELVPNNDHHLLLREYLRELQHTLQQLLRKTQEHYTLSLSGTETIAFYQLWHLCGPRHDKYAVVIVENMLDKMSSIAA